MPDMVSPFHASHGGSPGDAYCTGMFARDACGSHTRGVHDQRRPMYATPGGAPASLRWNQLMIGLLARRETFFICSWV